MVLIKPSCQWVEEKHEDKQDKKKDDIAIRKRLKEEREETEIEKGVKGDFQSIWGRDRK